MPEAKPPKSISPWLDSVRDERRFPILEGDVSSDVVVVGGGIVGVMTAWNLVNRGISVALLEKNHVATGDTGFTTGFLTRVPDTNISRLEKRYGADFVRKLFHASANAQSSLFKLIKEEKIDCDFSPCSSYYCSYEPVNEFLRNEWEALKKVEPRASFVGSDEDAGLGSRIAEAIKFEEEAYFNVRKFLFGLLNLPLARKIKVFEESKVVDVSVGEGITAKTKGGVVKAKQMVIATGLPLQAFSELRALFKPKISFALAARYEEEVPFSDNLFWDTYDPYFYYRRLDPNTVILGGADRYVGAQQAAGSLNPYETLLNFLNKQFPGNFTVTNKWSGSLFDSEDGLPYASEHPRYKGRVFVGSCCGFGGNGLVFGTLASSVVSDLIAEVDNENAPLFSFSRSGSRI